MLTRKRADIRRTILNPGHNDDRHWRIWTMGMICIGVSASLVLLYSEGSRSQHGSALWSMLMLSSAGIAIAAAFKALAVRRPDFTLVSITVGALFGFAGALGLLFSQHPTIASYLVAGFTLYYLTMLTLWTVSTRIKGSTFWAAAASRLPARKPKIGICTYCGKRETLNDELCKLCHDWMMLWK